MLLDTLPIFWPSCFYHFMHSSGFLPPLIFNSILSPCQFLIPPLFPHSSFHPFSHFPFIFWLTLDTFLRSWTLFKTRPVARIASVGLILISAVVVNISTPSSPVEAWWPHVHVHSTWIKQARLKPWQRTLCCPLGKALFSQCSSLYPCI